VDIIRPICLLLNPEYDGLENFEALMALGNLATLSENCRSRMIKSAEYINAIEGYTFEDHVLIRRAAIQLWSNLCMSPLMVQRCEGKNDKVKYCVLLCADDDDTAIIMAAAGSLAMLTSQSNKICKKVFEVCLIKHYITFIKVISLLLCTRKMPAHWRVFCKQNRLANN
jgi:hypothetical protein